MTNADGGQAEEYSFVGEIIGVASAVAELHRRFGLPRVTSESVTSRLPIEALRDMLPLLPEELGEFARGLNMGDYNQAGEELADLLALVLGIFWTHKESGIDWAESLGNKLDAMTPETHVLTNTRKIVLKTL